MMFSAFAYAGTSFTKFNVDVPALNGSKNSGSQTKAYTGRAGYIIVDYVGGGKELDCRMRDTKDYTEGAWVNNITTSSKKNVYSRASHEAGDTVCIRFSNKLTTVVEVNTSGDWRSDNVS